jgi:nicotine blue oxidoreductase
MVGAVILAAGRGRRMGGTPKALLALEGVSFLERSIRACRGGGCTAIRIVVSEGMEAVRAIAREHGAAVTVNPAPDRGMFSSVLSGLEALLHEYEDMKGFLIFPVDHPRVSEETVRALISSSPAGPARSWIQPVYGGQRGHPILIDALSARSLLSIPPECTLHGALGRCGLKPFDVPVDDPGILANVNTPADLAD